MFALADLIVLEVKYQDAANWDRARGRRAETRRTWFRHAGRLFLHLYRTNRP